MNKSIFSSSFSPFFGLMIGLHSAALITLGASAALADAPQFEVMCRQQAKEVAAESYRGCITENRKTQVEQLKNDYQQKLKSLKDEYEAEIKKMSGSTKTAAPSEASSPKVSRSASRSSSKTLTRSSALRSAPTLPAKSRSAEEMNVRLKPSVSSPQDESTMDIPEPIPVESVSLESETGGV